MSHKLLALDLEVLLDRLQTGTNFPYGDGDERLIQRINKAARDLQLPEPIAAQISDASVYIEVRRCGDGGVAASIYQAQKIALIIDGVPVHCHQHAMTDRGVLVVPLREWLCEAQRQQRVREMADEAPIYPEPTKDLTPLQTALRAILVEHAEREGPEARLSGGTLKLELYKRGFGSVRDDRISKSAAALTKKGCPCKSDGPHTGYRLVPCGLLIQSETEREEDGRKLARSCA